MFTAYDIKRKLNLRVTKLEADLNDRLMIPVEN